MAPLVSLIALGTLATASLVASSVLPITRVGNRLYDSTGARFFIKGVAYQQAGTLAIDPVSGFPEPVNFVDSLADSVSCTRDIPNFTALGVNTIHVYNLNPTSDHSACFNALNAAGIYVIADLGLPVNGSINRADPSWDTGRSFKLLLTDPQTWRMLIAHLRAVLDQYLTTLTSILPYPNLLAVSIANEVITAAANTTSAPFIKAAARDIKSFLKSKGSNVLVNYHSTDMGVTSQVLADYLACGSEEISIDIFGLNDYRFCGTSSFAASGYDVQTTEFTNYPVVVILSEFGCITSPRVWTDVSIIYSSPMSDVFSGAIAFEYFADSLGYGLTDNTTSVDGAITTNAQFSLLAAQYKAVTPPASTNATATASAYPSCASSAGTLAVTTTLPPTPDDQVCNCLSSSAFSCVVNPSTSAANVGTLINTACSLLGGQGGTCNPIAGNGATGVYGSLSGCSAMQKLSYVATMYYENAGAPASACSFNGNTTVNTKAPSSAAAVNASIASCLAALPASGTLVPSLSTGSSSTGSGNAGGSSSSASSSSATGTSAPAGKSAAGRNLGEGWGLVGRCAAAVLLAVGVGAVLVV